MTFNALNPWELYRILRSIEHKLDKLEIAMAVTQADIDALTTAVTAVKADIDSRLTDIETDTTNILAEIAALQGGNPNLDLSGLQAAVATLQTDQATLDTDVQKLGTIAPPA